MQTPANSFSERVACGILGCSFSDAARGTCLADRRRLRTSLTMRRLAVCVLAFLFLTCSLPAQQSGDAPGWPITNPMPSHGKVIPDPTIGLPRPETGPTDESCLLGAVDGAQRSAVRRGCAEAQIRKR